MGSGLVFSNIFARPLRSITTALAIGLEVALILLIVGLSQGMIEETSKRMEGVGADIALQPPNSSVLLAASTAAMSVKISQLIQNIEGVDAVTPIFLQFNTTGGMGLIWGIDLKSFNQVIRGFIFLSGSNFKKPDDVIIDDIYARANNLKVGDQLNLMNHSFQICGIVENGKGSRVFIPIAKMQELVGSHDKATLMLIKCIANDKIPSVIDKLGKSLKSYPIFDMNEFIAQMTDANKDFGPLKYFTNTVISVATLIGFFIIFLSMYTTVTERIHEIGILRSLGANQLYVSFVFLKEALALGAIGFLLGVGLTFTGRLLFSAISPTLYHDLSVGWIVGTGCLALLSASLGALDPAFRAGCQDPLEALAYNN